MNYDLEQIRGKFPALNIKDSGVRRIYFDNPAGTQVPIEVIEAVSYTHLTLPTILLV